MKSSLHPKKHIPNYVLISIALIQSEIYWFCSAIYCIFRKSGLLNEPPSTTITKRNRAHSAPPAFISFIKDSNVHGDEQSPERRFSLPTETDNIRERPTVKDEQAGTTCPPTWWQKTRVKLGHTPVHGDPKPRSILSNTASFSITPTMVSFAIEPATTATSSMKQVDSISSSISQASMSDSRISPLSFIAIDKKSLSPSLTFLSNCSTNSPSSIEDSSSTSQKKSTKKFLFRINAALHHHRRNNSVGIKK